MAVRALSQIGLKVWPGVVDVRKQASSHRLIVSHPRLQQTWRWARGSRRCLVVNERLQSTKWAEWVEWELGMLEVLEYWENCQM